MVAGLFLAARGPKSARFSSKCPIFGPCGAQYGAKNLNCCKEEARYQAKVCGNHESNPGTAAEGVGTKYGPSGTAKDLQDP